MFHAYALHAFQRERGIILGIYALRTKVKLGLAK